MPGDGQIDLKSEINTLKEMGYNGTVSLELFNESWWKIPPEKTLRVGLERMKELFES
jgi:2-keto-myo-inositol isomerase